MTAARASRCATCNHYETKHVGARGKLPAYCMSCTGARALHGMKVVS